MTSELDRLVNDRVLDHAKVRQLLDNMTVEEVVMDLGQPDHIERYQEPTMWHQGDPRPVLATDDPAVTIAMSKCALSRMRHIGPGPAVDVFHPDTCGFDDYPVEQLLLAVDFATWQARYLTSEMLVWRQAQAGPKRHVTYVRSGREPGYQNPAWRQFAALPAKEQRRRVLVAMESARG